MPSRCTEKLTKMLVEKPESGMGYQLVSFFGGLKPTHLVFGSQVIIKLGEQINLLEWSFRGKTDESIQGKIMGLTPFDEQRQIVQDEINVFPRFFLNQINMTGTGLVKIPSLKVTPYTASPPPLPALSLFFSGIAQSTDTFSRFCAFSSDPRLVAIPGGSQGFKPDTFATTDHDANCVTNGAAAVGRYALPFLAPAVYRKDFKVSGGVGGVPLRYGTALPAFFQAGGGSEVCFSSIAPAKDMSTLRLPEV
jgi:hypothetical protein